ncbi:MAG: DUF5689 domain-containing protein [Clostridium sp.]|nr:DUF5689 domain-containing protein [Clostridium sp.]
MKTKNIAYLLVMGLCLPFTSCMDGDWDDPTVNSTSSFYGNDAIMENVEGHISVADLKTKYKAITDASNQFSLITEDLQLKGIVTINDLGGNLTQQIVLDDGTGSIIIGITDNSIYAYLSPGQEILVNLKGLYIGGYGKQAQIGYPSTGRNPATSSYGVTRIGRMPKNIWYQHFRPIGTPDITRVDTVDFDPNWDMDTKACQIVRVTGVTLAGADGKKVLAEKASSDAGNGVNVTVNGLSKSLTLRTSTYADFASMVMPTGKVTLYGLLTRYNSTWQIALRYETDLVAE